MLESLEKRDDDWYMLEFPHVFGMVGEAAIGPLADYLADLAKLEYPRSCAAHGLCQVAMTVSDVRSRVVAMCVF